MSKYRVVYYKNNRGDLPVFKHLNTYNDQVLAKFNRLADLLASLGPSLSLPYSRKITHELFELRIKGKNEIRVIYTKVKDTYILLHAFPKKTKKTPKKEIETSESRRLTLK